MKEKETILDIEPQEEKIGKYVSYWRMEILLTKGIFLLEGIAFLSFLFIILTSNNTTSFLYWLVFLGPISHFFLGCWQVFNGIIFCFLDNANYKMRYKYLLYAIGTLLLIIPCAMLAEYLDNFNEAVAWSGFCLINLAILPWLVAGFYIKTLRKSIVFAKA